MRRWALRRLVSGVKRSLGVGSANWVGGRELDVFGHCM